MVPPGPVRKENRCEGRATSDILRQQLRGKLCIGPLQCPVASPGARVVTFDDLARSVLPVRDDREVGYRESGPVCGASACGVDLLPRCLLGPGEVCLPSAGSGTGGGCARQDTGQRVRLRRHSGSKANGDGCLFNSGRSRQCIGSQAVDRRCVGGLQGSCQVLPSFMAW
jgi:hypothetical protein